MKKRVEFTRTLAHELKTPLTPVMLSSQELVAMLKDETSLRLAKNISRGASNLSGRIDELLDLAKGEIGMLKLKREYIDVLQLLQEVVEEVSAVPRSRGQKLIWEPPASLPQVWADQVRVRQIVMNLLNNAFKFTPRQGQITIRANGEEGNVVIEVSDTGPGIKEEDQGRLFNPYHRLEGDREQLSGLGLGLALCKTLAELHGGQIWLKSSPGKGSTFGFSLPLGAHE
jgi:signal transduction histidine kinase